MIRLKPPPPNSPSATPKRLPKRKRVTLIVALPYPDGMVISADSQETVTDDNGNEYKYSVLKLKPEKMGQFEILIAGSGNGEAIVSFIEHARQFIPKSKPANLAELEKQYS